MSHTRRKQMAVNSLLAYWQGEEGLFEKREQDILKALRYAKDLTDREIMLALELPEPNCVRPRITELIKDGVLEQTGNKIDPQTGKRVRTVSLRADPRRPQAEFKFTLERQTA